MELVLSSLAPSSTYDLTLVASRLGVGDVQTTRFTASANVTASNVLDAANNVTQYVTLRGLSPDPAGEIRLEVRADASNTNLDGSFQINALRIRQFVGGSQNRLIAFADSRLDFARENGKGLFSSPISIYTNDGSAPTVNLLALDHATGKPPIWMAYPGSVSAGSAVPLTVEPEVVAAGTYSATLYGTSPGTRRPRRRSTSPCATRAGPSTCSTTATATRRTTARRAPSSRPWPSRRGCPHPG